MVWVGRDLRDHSVPTLCHSQGCHPAAQAAQGPIQPGLELQGRSIHSFSGQPVPLPHCPPSKLYHTLSPHPILLLGFRSLPFSFVIGVKRITGETKLDFKWNICSGYEILYQPWSVCHKRRIPLKTGMLWNNLSHSSLSSTNNPVHKTT